MHDTEQVFLDAYTRLHNFLHLKGTIKGASWQTARARMRRFQHLKGTIKAGVIPPSMTINTRFQHLEGTIKAGSEDYAQYKRE